MTLDFYLDFISSFGYLARGRLCEIARAHGLEVAYHPTDIHKLRALAGSTGPSNSQIPAKMAYLRKDFLRWADFYGLPMVAQPTGWQTATFNKGLLLASDRGQAEDYARQAYALIWAEGRDPGAEEVVAELESRMGWQAGELAEFAASDAATARYEAETEAASQRGVFGVPTFCIGEEMWWGNDRLDFLERYLASR